MLSDEALEQFRCGWSDRANDLPHAGREFFDSDRNWQSYCQGWDAQYQDEQDSNDYSLREHCHDE